MSDMSTKVLDAISLIAKKEISNISPDEIKNGIIESVINLKKNKYRVKIGTVSVNACGDNGAKYNIGDKVKILIPKGDYSAEKTILSLIYNIGKNEDILYPTASNKFIQMTPLSELLTNSLSLKLNEKNKINQQSETSIVNYSVPAIEQSQEEYYSAIYVKMQVSLMTNLKFISGLYGVKMDVTYPNSHEKYNNTYYFLSTEFLGNPYLPNNFDYEKIFIIPYLSLQPTITFSLIHNNNFYYLNENGDSTLYESSLDESMLQLKSLKIGLGHAYTGQTGLHILTNGNNEYNAIEGDENRQLKYIWYNTDDFGNFIGFGHLNNENLFDERKYQQQLRYDEILSNIIKQDEKNEFPRDEEGLNYVQKYKDFKNYQSILDNAWETFYKNFEKLKENFLSNYCYDLEIDSYSTSPSKKPWVKESIRLQDHKQQYKYVQQTKKIPLKYQKQRDFWTSSSSKLYYKHVNSLVSEMIDDISTIQSLITKNSKHLGLQSNEMFRADKKEYEIITHIGTFKGITKKAPQAEQGPAGAIVFSNNNIYDYLKKNYSSHGASHTLFWFQRLINTLTCSYINKEFGLGPGGGSSGTWASWQSIYDSYKDKISDTAQKKIQKYQKKLDKLKEYINKQRNMVNKFPSMAKSFQSIDTVLTNLNTGLKKGFSEWDGYQLAVLRKIAQKQQQSSLLLNKNSVGNTPKYQSYWDNYQTRYSKILNFFDDLKTILYDFHSEDIDFIGYYFNQVFPVKEYFKIFNDLCNEFQMQFKDIDLINLEKYYNNNFNKATFIEWAPKDALENEKDTLYMCIYRKDDSNTEKDVILNKKGWTPIEEIKNKDHNFLPNITEKKYEKTAYKTYSFTIPEDVIYSNQEYKMVIVYNHSVIESNTLKFKNKNYYHIFVEDANFLIQPQNLKNENNWISTKKRKDQYLQIIYYPSNNEQIQLASTGIRLANYGPMVSCLSKQNLANNIYKFSCAEENPKCYYAVVKIMANSHSDIHNNKNQILGTTYLPFSIVNSYSNEKFLAQGPKVIIFKNSGSYVFDTAIDTPCELVDSSMSNIKSISKSFIFYNKKGDVVDSNILSLNAADCITVKGKWKDFSNCYPVLKYTIVDMKGKKHYLYQSIFVTHEDNLTDSVDKLTSISQNNTINYLASQEKVLVSSAAIEPADEQYFTDVPEVYSRLRSSEFENVDDEGIDLEDVEKDSVEELISVNETINVVDGEVYISENFPYFKFIFNSDKKLLQIIPNDNSPFLLSSELGGFEINYNGEITFYNQSGEYEILSYDILKSLKKKMNIEVISRDEIVSTCD